MELSIVILNYKTKGLLKQCLRGIEDSQPNGRFEVIVVDNASHDGSVEMVRELFPWVKVIARTTNGGFAVGNNDGLRIATGDAIMIMNPDVAVFRGGIDALLSALRQNAKVGIAVPKLINPDGSIQMSVMRFPRFMTAFFRRTPIGLLPVPAEHLRRYQMDDWDHADERTVGWALGACLLIRREAMAAIGLFDERFFLYLEDVDYCRRAWAAGWEVRYYPHVEFVHYHERLSAKRPLLTGVFSYPARVHLRSWLKYFAKYFGALPPPKEHCV